LLDRASFLIGARYKPGLNWKLLRGQAHRISRGFFVDITHPIAGTHKYPGAPLKYHATPWEIRHPAPTLGQHNDQIFGGRLGISAARLDELKRTGVI